uniref:Sulfatase N-terminal domain-containing protein n=1 Tax=Trichuris muris TaxID=70415 RepID=A0A5S6R433_TRIMR
MLNGKAIVQHGNIRCNIVPFEFVDDFTVRTFNHSLVTNNTSVPTDFFKAECTAPNGKRYTNYHATIVRKQDSQRKVVQMAGFSRPLNIYFLGFDSLSRLMFMRKLKETYKYVTEVLNGTVLEMYNIVGDGTPAALLPILTGKTEEELPETRRSQRNASFVDAYPFIWKELKKFGYATLYAEDMQNIGTFTYRLKGFKQQPTEHYLRSFYRQVEKETHRSNQLCFGSELQHRVQLSYVEDFFNTYPREQPKFAFQFHSAYSHDDFNAVERADGATVEHLRFFEKNGLLNDTLLVVFSDHGSRYSAIRRTKQGKLEERNPFVSLILPTWFKEVYPNAVANLRKNSKRLTTPFDLHATLKSLWNFPPPLLGDLANRDISLFSEIPPSRDCTNADIPAHWCSCLSWKKLPKDALVVWFIAIELVKAFNGRLKEQEKLCSMLKLHSILEAYVTQPTDEYVAFAGAKDFDGRQPLFGERVNMRYSSYALTIVTSPGNGIFEATVLYDLTNRLLHINLDSVSRVNAYGSASHCIMSKDSYLAIWCVCRDKLS